MFHYIMLESRIFETEEFGKLIGYDYDNIIL